MHTDVENEDNQELQGPRLLLLRTARDVGAIGHQLDVYNVLLIARNVENLENFQ